MLGLDTNVLVRFLVEDDQSQFEAAQSLIAREVSRGRPVGVCLLVLLETEWVLRSRYGLSPMKISGLVEGLLSSGDVIVEDDRTVESALANWNEHGGEFADRLIGARNLALGCQATVTFDVKAAKLSEFVLL